MRLRYANNPQSRARIVCPYHYIDAAYVAAPLTLVRIITAPLRRIVVLRRYIIDAEDIHRCAPGTSSSSFH